MQIEKMSGVSGMVVEVPEPFTENSGSTKKGERHTEVKVLEISDSDKGQFNITDIGPGTIESGDEIENFSDSDSEAEDQIKYRVKRVGNETEFYDDFQFIGSVNDYLKDTWDEVLKYMKPRKSVDITKTIAKVRLEEKEKRKRRKEKQNEAAGDDVTVKKEPVDDDSSSDSDTDMSVDDVDDDSGEEFLPDTHTADQLRQREAEVRRKERRKDRPVKIKKSLKEMQQEDVDSKFFEDAPPCQPDATFLEMNFSRQLTKAIDRLGYDNPTPIQAATIPVAMQGRDVCGCAATGTGKTAAYMLPILERLLFKPAEDVVTRVLVLVPTRELGVQVFEVSKDLARYTQLQVALSVGGLDLKSQVEMLKKVPDIVIATPGRLIDHVLNTPTFSLDNIEILVLDEADRMLDDSFDEQMNKIVKECAVNRQTMLFSATMTSKVKELALVSLKNPVKVFVNENTDVARNLRQEFVRIRKNHEGTREAMLAYLVSRSFNQHTMVFVTTKIQAHRLNILMGLLGVRAGELHGNLKQNERLLSLKKFKDEEVDILIATDVAARGLDIKGVKTVINYNLPTKYTKYVHRVGRTARAGHCGRSVSLAGEKEFLMLKEIKRCSRSAMYERVLNKDILEKYVSKIKKLEGAVERVLKEEIEEKKLRAMENSILSLERQLNAAGQKEENPEPERKWFQTKEEMLKKETKKNTTAGKRHMQTKKAEDRKRKKLNAGNPEERKLMRDMKMSQLQAKRSNKTQRLYAVGKQEEQSSLLHKAPRVEKKVKNKSKSSFDAELTRTDRKSVKRFRAGPSFNERKEAFQKKNPGKKFINPKKKK